MDDFFGGEGDGAAERGSPDNVAGVVGVFADSLYADDDRQRPPDCALAGGDDGEAHGHRKRQARVARGEGEAGLGVDEAFAEGMELEWGHAVIWTDSADGPFQKNVDAGKNSGEEDDGGFFPELASAADPGFPAEPEEDGTGDDRVKEMAGLADGEGDVSMLLEPGGDAAGVGEGGEGDIEK